MSGLSLAYYLAADGGKIYVDGNDPSNSIAVGSINLTSEQFEEVASASSSGFFPGGIVFDKSHTLIWNNEFAYLYTLPKAYKRVSSTLEYNNGTNPLIDTQFALESTETTLPAGNCYSCKSTAGALPSSSAKALGDGE